MPALFKAVALQPARLQFPLTIRGVGIDNCLSDDEVGIGLSLVEGFLIVSLSRKGDPAPSERTVTVETEIGN
jgi:hypothetical protein